ncbi:MAG: hypothetical protein U0792_15440 [Gemmataceae bacterium]
MFVTYPFGDNTTTINIAHISHVVWSRPMAGAAVATSIFFVGGKSIDLHLTPAQIRQLEGNLADFNRRQEGKR